MPTQIQLFRDGRKLTACALGEPSVTFVGNDAKFELLLADGVHEDSFTSGLYLDAVSHLSIAGKQWSCCDFESVAIYEDEGAWCVRDAMSGRAIPVASQRPYRVIFISRDEYRRLQAFCSAGMLGRTQSELQLTTFCLQIARGLPWV
jgi:hypothetical protein